ncbi:hypothetical protein BC332_02926 [Capsicum chinense]|nr:hypothetical protein BC332_02926 [Capsicum chinense]
MQAAQYINSDIRGVPPQLQTPKPLSCFTQRLKGKHRQFHGNLSGKRVEYTGRTVISPDPNLRITEVAIPILMARDECNPYNADGDGMNTHEPETEEARTELLC